MFINKISYILRKIGYLLISLFLIFLVMVLIARMFTPLLNERRAEFEHWAEKVLGAPVQIGYLEAKWKGLEPDIMLKDVTVLDTDHKQALFHLNELQININLFESLLSRHLQPSTMKVVGVHLIIHQLSDGSFRIQSVVKSQKQPQKGTKASELTKKIYQTLLLSKSNEKKHTTFIPNNLILGDYGDELLAWLFSRSHLSLKDVVIDFKKPGKEDLSVALKNLKLKKRGSQHILYGNAKVLEPSPMFVHVGLSFRGDLGNGKKLEATLYVKLKHVLLQKWLLHKKFHDSQIDKGILNGEFWLEWKNNKWRSIQSVFDIHQLVLQSKIFKHPLDIKKFSGHILWKKVKHDIWQLSGDQIILDMKNHSFPENQFILRVNEKEDQKQQKLWIHYINIEEIKNIVSADFFIKLMPHLKTFFEIKSKGELWDSYLDHQGIANDWGHFDLYTRFYDLSLPRLNKIPGVTHLSGALQIKPNAGKLFVNSTDSIFDFGPLFKKPLTLQILSGNMSWYRDDEGTWVIKSEKISAADDYAALSGQFGLLWPRNSNNPILNLFGGFHIDEAQRSKDYLPVGILDQALVKWLDQAILKGEGSGTVLFRGPVQEFPFDHQRGTFIVDTKIKDVDLHYAKDWPELHKINGNLIFSNRTMSCQADSGEIQGAKVQSLQASIPYMGDEKPVVLSIKGKTKGDIQNLINFITKSPLKHSVDESISDLHGKGKAQLNLEMSIPITKQNKTLIKGEVNFSDAMLEVIPWHLQLSRLKGTIDFTEDTIHSDNLRANLFGKTIQFFVKTVRHQKEKPFTQVNFQTDLDTKMLEKHFKYSMPFIQGKTNLNASLNLYTVPGDTRRDHLDISSDLSGIKIDLPLPFKKEEKEKIPSRMTMFFSREVKVHFGNRFSSALLFQLKEKKLELSSVHLHLGSKDTSIQKEKGLWIDGFLSTLDWKSWKEYLSEEINGINRKLQRKVQVFVRSITVTVGKMNFLGQSFTNTAFKIQPKNSGWTVHMTNQKVQGDIFIVSKKLTRPTLVGTFKRLHLSSGFLETQKELRPNELPVLNIKSEDFQYGDWHFGKINLIAKPEGKDFQIKQLLLSSPELSLDLQGNWKSLKTGKYSSEVFGEAKTENLSKLFKKWKIKSNLVGTTGYARFHLDWIGAIYDPLFQQMEGDISFRLGNGQVIKLDKETVAKLNLGFILSSLSLHRLISMDFYNLTHEGYTFDKVKGNLSLKKGHITTHNTYFDGSIAKIDVKGDIDIVKKILDLNLVIKPYITSSLPIVATLTGGPVAGGVAWVADKVFGKEISKLTTYHYNINGDWDNPVVKEIKHHGSKNGE